MTDTDRPAWLDDELFSFESRFVAIDGHTVHYVNEGSGPTLLLLHGNPTWSFVYRDVIRALGDEFRCIALDYPRFGLSPARPSYRFLPEEHTQVVTAFVDALDLSGVTLVAHDWATHRPRHRGAATGRVRGSGAGQHLGLARHGRPPLRGRLPPDGRTAGTPADQSVEPAAQRPDPRRHRLRKPTAAEMAHYRQALATAGRRDASAVLPRRITASRSFLAEVEAGLADLALLPALIVWGNADFAFGAKERQRWEQIFADDQTVIVEGAGYFVQSDAPDRFAAAIRDWRAQPAQRDRRRRGVARREASTES
jgi:haloalkane dehalogenase